MDCFSLPGFRKFREDQKTTKLEKIEVHSYFKKAPLSEWHPSHFASCPDCTQIQAFLQGLKIVSKMQVLSGAYASSLGRSLRNTDSNSMLTMANWTYSGRGSERAVVNTRSRHLYLCCYDSILFATSLAPSPPNTRQ